MWKIAIIDDERQVLQGMKRVIPWEELNAEWAGEALNGADGLALIRAEQPDIVITDIYMPVMNGIEMIQQLREEGYGGKIIILSGYSDFEHARQALRHGISDYVSKPISVPTLKELLGKMIAELADEEEKRIRQYELEHRWSIYEPFIEREWVKSVAAGTLDYRLEENNRHMPDAYAYWHNTKHIVIGIHVVKDIRAGQYTPADWNLLRYAIGNIACELAVQSFSLHEYTELHGARAVLLLHLEKSFEPEQLASKLYMLGKELILCVKQYLKLTIHVGIGGLKESWTEIADSTEEAFRAIEHREKRVEPAMDLFQFNPVAGESKRFEIRPVKFYYELASAMKATQQTKAEQLVAQYVKQLEEQPGISDEIVQMIAGELWGIFAYCLYEIGITLDELFSAEQIFEEIDQLKSPQELGQWLSDKIAYICGSRAWKGNSKHKQIINFMTDYMDQHYGEELTLGDLADKVFISRNHLSIIFKNITGETFNNYLTKVRMEKARELLLDRNMLVYEVAERVGYKNVPYFSTIFKKYTGLNPTELIK